MTMPVRLANSLTLIAAVSLCAYDTLLAQSVEASAEELVLTQEVADLKAKVERLEAITSLLLGAYERDHPHLFNTGEGKSDGDVHHYP